MYWISFVTLHSITYTHTHTRTRTHIHNWLTGWLTYGKKWNGSETHTVLIVTCTIKGMYTMHRIVRSLPWTDGGRQQIIIAFHFFSALPHHLSCCYTFTKLASSVCLSAWCSTTHVMCVCSFRIVVPAMSHLIRFPVPIYRKPELLAFRMQWPCMCACVHSGWNDLSIKYPWIWLVMLSLLSPSVHSGNYLLPNSSWLINRFLAEKQFVFLFSFQNGGFPRFYFWKHFLQVHRFVVARWKCSVKWFWIEVFISFCDEQRWVVMSISTGWNQMQRITKTVFQQLNKK